MKRLLLLITIFISTVSFGQNVNIPDPNFKTYLIGNPNINTNGDTEIQISEASVFNGEINVSNSNIYDLTGIEAFTALTTLYCSNNQLVNLDLSQNLYLESLNCAENSLISLDISQNLALTVLRCSNNELTSLDISQNLALTDLDCGFNQLTNIDVSQNTSLVHLLCDNNQLSSLDVSQNTALVSLLCYNNQLSSLDVSLDFCCQKNP